MFATEYAVATKLDHPRSVNLREDQLLPRIDAWLAEVFSEDHIDETCEAMAAVADVHATIDTTAIKAAIRDCDKKLGQYRKAIEAGTDPTVVAGWIKQVTAERAAAQAKLIEAGRRSASTLSAEQIRAEVEAIGGLLPLLHLSDTTLRSKLYEEIGLEGVYDPKAQVVDVELRVLKVRVGGAITPLRTRIVQG